MKTIYQVTDEEVHAHMTEDGVNPYCGAVLEGETSDQMIPNCEECDAKYIDRLGRACMHGPLPAQTQRLLLDIMYRYHARHRRVLVDAHQALENGPEVGVEFQRKHPKPLTHWQARARDALRAMRRNGEGTYDDRAALESIVQSGNEPYHTLKALMDRLL